MSFAPVSRLNGINGWIPQLPGLYLLESKLYVIEARVNPGSPPGGIFQQSFEFIDENGNGIFFQESGESFRHPRKVREGGEWIRP